MKTVPGGNIFVNIIFDKADERTDPERKVRKWFLPDQTQGVDVPGLGVLDFLDCANVMFPQLAAKARVPICWEGQIIAKLTGYFRGTVLKCYFA